MKIIALVITILLVSIVLVTQAQADVCNGSDWCFVPIETATWLVTDAPPDPYTPPPATQTPSAPRELHTIEQTVYLPIVHK